jgi:excisionase family DNA binding protein
MNQNSEWVSLGEAAQIIGVHPATIRNWAERGEIPYRRTPGGHRRFRRADLRQWQAAHRLTHPAEAQVIVQSAMGRTRMEISDKGKLAELDWYDQLSPEAREGMREEGLRLMDTLMGYLANPESDVGLNTAYKIGVNYGKLLKGEELTLSKALQGYFFFSDFLLDAVLQLSETATAQAVTDWSAMLRQVHRFIRQILVGMAAAYEQNCS